MILYSQIRENEINKFILSIKKINNDYESYQFEEELEDNNYYFGDDV